MAKHTPGPWIVTNDGRYVDVYDGQTARDLSGAWTGNWTNLIAQCAVLNRKANGRLIAAAPELLAACKAFDEFAWTAVAADCEEARLYLQSIIDTARAAIAKAEGG